MGYYTAYGLSIHPDAGHLEDEDKFYKELLEMNDNDREVKEFIEEGGVFGKLYDIEDDIASLAPKYPHLLIVLSGDGEEPGDNWEHRWKGEEDEYHEVQMPPFTNPNLQIPKL